MNNLGVKSRVDKSLTRFIRKYKATAMYMTKKNTAPLFWWKAGIMTSG